MCDYNFFNQLIQSNFIVEEFKSNPQQQDVWIRYNGHLVKLTCVEEKHNAMHGPNKTEFARTYFPDIPWFPNTYQVIIESEGFGYRMSKVDFWNEDTQECFVSGLKNILATDFGYGHDL